MKKNFVVHCVLFLCDVMEHYDCYLTFSYIINVFSDFSHMFFQALPPSSINFTPLKQVIFIYDIQFLFKHMFEIK